MKVLFLSLEKQHDEIFQKIEQSLRRVADESILCKIVDTSNMIDIPPFYRLDREKVVFASRILCTFQPDVVVVANDHGVNATFIAFCKLMGIPTLAIQDGVLSNLSIVKPLEKVLMKNKAVLWRLICLVLYNRLFLNVAAKIGWPARRVCWGTTPIDRIAVMGEYYKKVFIDRGVHVNKINVTGYPLLDGVTSNALCLCKKDLSKKIGFDRNKPLVLLITQPFVEDGLWGSPLRALHFDSVVNAVKHVNGQLIVKVHPRERHDVYELLANKHHDINIVVTKDFNLDRLLLSSDVILTVSSTVGLWAMAYKKPLLVMNCFPIPFENVLASMALSVDELDKLPIILNQILSDESQKTSLIAKELHSLHNHLYLLDGCASARIAKLILTLANNCRQIST